MDKTLFSFNRQNYFILECLGPDVPASYLMRVNPGTSTLKSVTLLDNNSETLEASNKLALPTMEKLIIKLPGLNFEILTTKSLIFIISISK